MTLTDNGHKINRICNQESERPERRQHNRRMMTGKDTYPVDRRRFAKECPKCGHKKIFAYSYRYRSAVCANCRALLRIHEHEIKLVIEDAAKRIPQVLQWLDSRKDIIEDDIQIFF